MSNLLELGFSPVDIATITAHAKICQDVDYRSLDSLSKAEHSFNTIYEMLNRKLRNGSELWETFTENFGLKKAECAWTGDTYPHTMMVVIPDGNNRWCKASMLLRGEFEWEFSANGTIIRNARLYGDRDILNYTTDPLSYLKFRNLPTEKARYDNRHDECINDEYSGIAPVFLGIELEVERKKDCPAKIAHMVSSDLGADYVILKSDSSIQNGFEIVTAPATIGFHKLQWDKFFDKEKGSSKYLTSWSSGRCGMHVHISRAALTPLHIGKFIAFINNNENREFVTTIAGRNSTFSRFVEGKMFQVKSKLVSHIVNLTKQLHNAKDTLTIEALEKEIVTVTTKLKATQGNNIATILNEMAIGCERHTAVNLAKKGTIELRIFRGNVSKVGMFKNLEFTHAVVEFTREATFRTAVLNQEEIAERKRKRTENTDYSLHYTYFIDWLEKDTSGNYENLKMYLASHKLTNKYARKKLSSKAPADKNITDDDIRECA